MIYYKLKNLNEKIRISSLEELRKKDFWNDIVYLDCSYNKITNLDNLPTNLQILHCSYNEITNLDNLPNSLKILNGEKYVNPNILDSYLNKTIDIQQLEEHFELIDSCCEICKTETKCINKCHHKFCIDCIIEMYKVNKRTD
jgi:Leucine-rich repeat (LRR) protein